MPPNLEFTTLRLHEALHARLGRPLAEAGVLTTTRALAMSAANLAVLEATWRFDAPSPAAANATRR